MLLPKLKEREIMVNTIKSMAVACVMGVAALVSSSSFAALISDSACPDPTEFPLNGCSFDGENGVRDGSFPYIDNVVAVTAKVDKSGKETITAKQYKGSLSNLFYDDTGNVSSISNMKFSLKATIDAGQASGSIKVSGTIGGAKGSMTADIGPEFASSADNTLWAFNTNNMVCKDGLEGICSTGEVVYLNLLEALPGSQDTNTKVSTAGRAITSLPVPAAAWLFGSGLLGLVAVSRRRGDRV
jgi:hypothetical protein